MSKRPALLYSGMVLTMLLWGLTFVVFKFAYVSFKPITIVFLRLVISVVFLFFIARSLKKLQPVKKKDYRYLLLLAFFEPFLYFMGESFGLTFVSSTVGAVIISTIPLIVPVGAYIIFKEKLSVLNWIGLIISFSGVLIVILSSNSEIEIHLKGVLLMFLAVLSAVGYGLTVKKLTHAYNGFTITAYQNAIGILFFIPFFLMFDMREFLRTTPSIISVLSIIYLAIFGSSVTFIIFTKGVRELGTSRANIFTNLIPVFAALFSYLLLKEPMPSAKIFGIIIVLAGLLMSQVRGVQFKKQKLPASNYQYPP